MLPVRSNAANETVMRVKVVLKGRFVKTIHNTVKYTRTENTATASMTSWLLHTQLQDILSDLAGVNLGGWFGTLKKIDDF